MTQQTADTVELEFFGRVPWKVHAVDAHLSRTWLVTFDERDHIAVWDTSLERRCAC